MTALATPTIHLNGTSKNSLLEDICEAIAGIDHAGKLLARTCPNGRDYYVQANGEDAINTALDQHDARMRKLREVVNELETIAMAIDS